MRIYFSFYLVILLSFILQDTSRQKINRHEKPGGTARWTGTITLNETLTGPSGTSERHVTVSFNDALPTLNRDIDEYDSTGRDPTDMNFTDDKGTGNVTYHAEGYINGKKVGTTDCQGSGKSELHEVEVNEIENTYSFHAIGPACSGTTFSLLDGKTSDYGPEFTDLTIPDQQLVNKNLLAGTYTREVEIGPTLGTVTRTLTWHLSRSSGSAELIVTPQNYDNWLPEPGTNELTKGTTIKIDLKVFGRNGQPPASKARSFELKLSNTSTEPGITLNAPLVPLTTLPDLRFLPQPNASVADEFQSATIQCRDGINGSITIAAFDGGAYTTLTAVAILEDNSRIEGHLLISGGNTEVLIPKRSPNSKIGVAWSGIHGDPADMDDVETSQGNNNNGDGLTAYEEYRGVIANGQFKRLDPEKKELGVWQIRTQGQLFANGLEWFENATGITIIRFYENEIGADRRLNKNFLTAHSYDQYALKLLKKHVRRNVMGRVEPGPGTPKAVKYVYIDYNQIEEKQQILEQEGISQNVAIPFSLEEMVAKTVAHELGHGVSIHHHGNHAIDTLNRWIQTGNPRIFLPRAIREETGRPYHLVGSFGRTGGQQSGDIYCIMCYNPCLDWSVKENNGVYFFYMVPLLPIGNLMCEDPAGTDINATEYYFGNATLGNCLSQIKLK